jgi:hypothetical protein
VFKGLLPLEEVLVVWADLLELSPQPTRSAQAAIVRKPSIFIFHFSLEPHQIQTEGPVERRGRRPKQQKEPGKPMPGVKVPFPKNRKRYLLIGVGWRGRRRVGVFRRRRILIRRRAAGQQRTDNEPE